MMAARLVRLVGALLVVLAAPTAWGEEAPPAGESTPAAAADEDSTGTDPRAFGSKLMPYWRFDHLENGVDSWQFTLFGMQRISDNFAMTYEIPFAKETDISDLKQFKRFNRAKDTLASGGMLPASIVSRAPDGLGSGTLNQVSSPFSGFGPDGETFGIGDSNLRLFFKDESLSFDSPFRDGSGEFMLGGELLVPTATKDVLGGDTWVLSPLITVVMDMPLPFSFIALMNFYDFDIHKKGGGGGDVSRFRGRWFYMQPLTPPGDKWYGGLYLLPELQPVYDFQTDHFSLWIAPEFGKILAPGRIFYLKPGFGISEDTDAGDRDWTFEIGYRYFF